MVSTVIFALMLLNDVDLEDFIMSGTVMDFSKHRVHPLYGFQQKNLDKESKEMISARINNVTMDAPSELIPEDFKNATN
jgi:hypothetical protein